MKRIIEYDNRKYIIIAKEWEDTRGSYIKLDTYPSSNPKKWIFVYLDYEHNLDHLEINLFDIILEKYPELLL